MHGFRLHHLPKSSGNRYTPSSKAMTTLIQLIDALAFWIYIACGLAILVCLRATYLARKERKAARFTVEKEMATGKAYRATITILGLLVIISFVALVDFSLAPSLTTTVTHSTPQARRLVLPTPSNTPVPRTPTPAAPRGPLVRRIPSSTPTSEPTPTRTVLRTACPDPGARITRPGVNQSVRGLLQVKGTANIEDFRFYKVEFGYGHDQTEFHVIGGLKYSPVNDGVLIVWDSTDLSGPVTLRLTVVNMEGNFPTPCEVPVIVQAW